MNWTIKKRKPFWEIQNIKTFFSIEKNLQKSESVIKLQIFFSLWKLTVCSFEPKTIVWGVIFKKIRDWRKEINFYGRTKKNSTKSFSWKKLISGFKKIISNFFKRWTQRFHSYFFWVEILRIKKSNEFIFFSFGRIYSKRIKSKEEIVSIFFEWKFWRILLEFCCEGSNFYQNERRKIWRIFFTRWRRLVVPWLYFFF